MIRNAVLAMLALVCAASIADARPRASGLHPRCNIDWPCAGGQIAKTKEEFSNLFQRRRGRPVGAKNAQTQPPDKVSGFDLLWENPTIQSAGNAPVHYIAGRLKCAVNVNAALAARGIRGTGSAWARSFLNWGRASHPVPGAVAVYSRGRRSGHVALVSRVEGGRVYVLNPSSRRQRWVETVYPRRALAYRVAG